MIDTMFRLAGALVLDAAHFTGRVIGSALDGYDTVRMKK